MLEALVEGRTFLARGWVGDARGSRFWAETGDAMVDARRQAMGGERLWILSNPIDLR